MNNFNYTRTLHVNFDWEAQDDVYFHSEWAATTIDRLEDLSTALQITLKSNNAKTFLRACEEAGTVIQQLNDAGLKRAVAKLKAHFKKEIKLDDLSFRRNAARLQAIGKMLIEAMMGRGMTA